MNNQVYIVVTPFFPSPTSWRGAYCYDFVKALTRALEVKVKDKGEQRKVVVFTEGDGSDYEVSGVKVYTFKTRRLPSNIFPFLFNHYNQRSFLKKVEDILCSTLSLRPSTCYDSVAVVHAHTANFAIYAEAMKKTNPKCKTLLHHHDNWSFGYGFGRLRNNRIYRFVQTPLFRKLHKRMDYHVFISKVSRQHFISDAGFEPKRSLILHNGVDENIFKVKVKGEGEQRENDSFDIGCVGNFSDEVKDYPCLFRALKRVKDAGLKFACRIIGGGELPEEFARQIDVLGIRDCLEFLPAVRHEELPEFYRGLDLFVLPSYFEGFGCVYTEAYACGVPFIGVKAENGIADLAPDEWLIPPHDDKALAEKILTIREMLPLKGEYRIRPLVKNFVKELGL